MRKISNLALVSLLVVTTAALVQPALAFDCVAHRFGELGRKSATITLAPTGWAPQASGSAQVRFTEAGRTVRIDARDLPDPSGLRPEYLTYVAWAVPQQGAPIAIGELRPDGNRARLEALVRANSFGVIVTAEPYFAASQPSDSVVLRSLVEGKLATNLSTAQFDCTLSPMDRYAFGRGAGDMTILLKPGSKISPELLQARNARKIAELAGADRLAPELFGEASQQLVQAEQIQARRPGSKEVVSPAIASTSAANRAYLAALAGQEREREVAERQAREEQQAAQRADELAWETAQREAEQRAERDAEMRAIKERQQQLERDMRADAERRVALEKQLDMQLEQQRAAREAGSSAPFGVSSDLRAERERLDAERAQLQAEQIQSQANLQVERARIEALRATLRAQLALENVERDRDDNKVARAEIEEVKREAEAARIDAERLRREAEVTAERARGEAERARLEAEIKTREAERQRLAQETAYVAPAVTPQEIEAAREAQLERTRLQVELSAMQQAIEQERARVAAEQQASEARQALEHARVEAERVQVQAELDRLRVQLDAERTAREAGSQRTEAERTADERRRQDAQAALEIERRTFQAEIDAQQRALAESREAQVRREQEIEAERVRLQQELAAERAAMQQATAVAANAARQQGAAAQVERRAQLLTQLTEVLEAQDTDRGLLVNMSDVGFAPGRFELTPAAQTTLARLAGILLAYPGLKLEIEGHTDSTGSAEGNQVLSERRAGAVRDFFLSQGVASSAMTARGFGSDRPVASNESADGRRANRRITCVISGSDIDVASR